MGKYREKIGVDADRIILVVPDPDNANQYIVAKQFSSLVPAVQASTASDAVVTGSVLDVRAFRSVCYTMTVATHDVTWTVFGANASDFSDEQVVKAAASVAIGASDTYAVAQAPYAYYRAKIRDTVGGTHGSATINGISK